MFRLLSVLVIALLLFARPSAAEFRSYAVVQDDAALVRTRWCDSSAFISPTLGSSATRNCAPFSAATVPPQPSISRLGFVTCQEMGTYDDGSISAICWTRRLKTDLGAYLIRQGLALAGPDAPEYQALERIAQTNGLGVWGFQADQFRQVFTAQPRRAMRFR